VLYNLPYLQGGIHHPAISALRQCNNDKLYSPYNNPWPYQKRFGGSRRTKAIFAWVLLQTHVIMAHTIVFHTGCCARAGEEDAALFDH